MKSKLFICGSHKVQDESFVLNMLSNTKAGIDLTGRKLTDVYVGNYPGTDQIVRAWAKDVGVNVVNFSLQGVGLSHSALSEPLSDIVLRHDKNIKNAVNEFIKLKADGLNLGLVIPNESGKLGVTASNLEMIMGLSKVPVQRGDIFSSMYKEVMALQPLQASVEQTSVKKAKLTNKF